MAPDSDEERDRKIGHLYQVKDDMTKTVNGFDKKLERVLGLMEGQSVWMKRAMWALGIAGTLAAYSHTSEKMSNREALATQAQSQKEIAGELKAASQQRATITAQLAATGAKLDSWINDRATPWGEKLDAKDAKHDRQIEDNRRKIERCCQDRRKE